MNWPNNTCDPIREHADWLPLEYISTVGASKTHGAGSRSSCRYYSL